MSFFVLYFFVVVVQQSSLRDASSRSHHVTLVIVRHRDLADIDQSPVGDNVTCFGGETIAAFLNPKYRSLVERALDQPPCLSIGVRRCHIYDVIIRLVSST